MRSVFAAAALILAVQTLPASAQTTQATTAAPLTATEVWRIGGFKVPEGVLWDLARSVLYVSNIDGDPFAKDNSGFISRLSPEGKVLEMEWVTGLNAPKGMAVNGDTLYVSDIDELAVIDIPSGKVTARHKAPGAVFLNDIAVDGEGRVYVSDMFDNAIWRLDGTGFTQWLKTEKLQSPNGLRVKGDDLIVASWGIFSGSGSFATTLAGHMKAVSLTDKAVRTLGDGSPVGNLDGLEFLPDGSFLVTDWLNGALLRIEPSGKATVLVDFPQGSADHAWIAERGLAVIPLMLNGEVAAFTVK